MNNPSISAAVVSAKQETNIAGLATINFDFSMVKVEPPVSFRALGGTLSTNRRQAAEEGLQHVTARKLGALFSSILPDVSYLVAAYGQRACEIAEIPNSNPRGSRDDGAFASFVGADATSIWAAATSGPEAILAHLLACMLARMWSPQEAVSIWHEVVEARRKILQRNKSNPACLAASQVTLSRAQLADWDASARAWLEIADEAKLRNQRQLMLIVQKFGMVVNNKESLYQSVTDAWIQAMTAVDKLIQGIPQNVQSGAILLGLTSWHLYPDMMALESSSSNPIQQDDPLLNSGGLLTLGLRSCSPNLPEGIFWSLPLAYMRYYGDPVIVTKAVGTYAGYVSMDDLSLIALGCLFRDWNLSSRDFMTGARLICTIETCLSAKPETKGERDSPSRCPYWVRNLSDAAHKLLETSEAKADLAFKTVSWGHRRGSGFLSKSPCSSKQYFGLCDPEVYFSLLRQRELKFQFLRYLAKNIEVRTRYKHEMMISYRTSPGGSISLATAMPLKEKDIASHHRWLSAGHNTQSHTASVKLFGEWEASWALKEKTPETTSQLGLDMPALLDEDKLYWLGAPSRFEHECWQCKYSIRRQMFDIDGSYISCQLTREPAVKQLMDLYNPPTQIEDGFEIVLSPPKIAVLHRCFGDSKDVALFSKERISVKFAEASSEPQNPTSTWNPCTLVNPLSLTDILDLFSRNLVDPIALCAHLGTEKALDQFRLRSLHCLAIASSIYEDLPGARVHIDVTKSALHMAKWAPTNISYGEQLIPRLSTQRIFACISRFETGSLDCAPAALEQAIALSTGNSLYIASSLLNDPIEREIKHPVKRMPGNIGKPGLVILIPPPEPRSRNLDHGGWAVIDHAPYDGTVQDSFEHTSLHLSLTDYFIPFTTEHEGFRDVEATFQEAVISIFDRCEWVADLDVVKSLNKLWHFSQLRQSPFHLPKDCPQKEHSPSHRWLLDGTLHLISVDNWHELIDRPIEVAVVRASGNWVGRLATACLSAQKGHKTVILPNKFCFSCAQGEVTNVIDGDGPITLIL